jgi:GT2 family glycosyltransferase
MRKHPLVSIVIVSWNGLDWLQLSIPTVYKQTYSRVEIIVVDNASTDGSTEWLKKNYPQVKVISLPSNTGYAEANNIGFNKTEGEYVLFLNNDVKTTPTYLEEMVHVLESDEEIGGVQSKILLLRNPKQLDSIGAFLTPTGFLYHYAFMNMDHPSFDKQIDLFTAKGASMMFKKDVLMSVLVNGQLFDSDSFAYFEETDMCHRVWLSGKRIVYAPKSVLYHQMGGTSTAMDQGFIQFHSFKNRISSYLKNLEFKNSIRILSFHLLCCQLFAVLYLCKGKGNVSLAIERAIFWNILNLGIIWKKRSIIQRDIRKISDATYFPKVFRPAPFGFYLSQAKAVPCTEKV